MAGKKRRRAYLDDFVQDVDGKFSYAGRHYEFDGDDKERKRSLSLIAGCMIASAALLTALGFMQNEGGSLEALILIPWLLCVLSLAYAAWAFVRILWARNRLREYIYEATAKKMALRSRIVFFVALAAAGCHIVYFCINGTGQLGTANVVRPFLSLINGAVCLLLHLLVKGSMRYREI